MNRIFQIGALCLSLAMLTFLACRAQAPKPPPANDQAPAAAAPDAGSPDAAPPPPEVYFPASKSGGAFLQHQQAPR